MVDGKEMEEEAEVEKIETVEEVDVAVAGKAV